MQVKRRSPILKGAVLLAAMTLCAQTTDKRFVIVVVGPTGSGKTTQTEFIRKRFGIPTLNADDLIRGNPAAVEKYQTPGIDPGPPQLSPALNDLVRDALRQMDLRKGVVLDGYPATKDQADHLAGLVAKFALPAPIVIHLDVPDAMLRQRLKARKREDDTPQQVEQRLKNYHRELDMMRSYYPQANIWSIDGSKPVAEVSQTIESILKDELPKK